MASTSVVSVKVVGWCSLFRVARRASNSDCDSVGRTRKAPARPWRVLFSAEAVFPASLFGPVENLAFSRLASIWDSVDTLGMLLRTRVWIAGVRGDRDGAEQSIEWAGDRDFSGRVNGPPATGGSDNEGRKKGRNRAPGRVPARRRG